jgi:hypothetical protein
MREPNFSLWFRWLSEPQEKSRLCYRKDLSLWTLLRWWLSMRPMRCYLRDSLSRSMRSSPNLIQTLRFVSSLLPYQSPLLPWLIRLYRTQSESWSRMRTSLLKVSISTSWSVPMMRAKSKLLWPSYLLHPSVNALSISTLKRDVKKLENSLRNKKSLLSISMVDWKCKSEMKSWASSELELSRSFSLLTY